MPDDFQDLNEFLQDALRLPINGKMYEVPPLSAYDGIDTVRQAYLMKGLMSGEQLTPAQIAELNLDAEDKLASQKHLLGPAFDEMVTDGVGYLKIQRAAATMLALVLGGREAAKAAWKGDDGDGSGKAPTEPSSPTT